MPSIPEGEVPEPAPISKGASRLVWEKADGSRIEFHLQAAVHLVGREGGADIQVDEPLVSRNHARLERRGETWVVLDLGSTNYTRVNGNRIAEAELHHGDEVKFGRARCVFLTAEGAEPEGGRP
jgi:pSer/pThr/pTyr-binding forkhead associated (FHA) protein